jgi:hypothetical protein
MNSSSNPAVMPFHREVALDTCMNLWSVGFSTPPRTNAILLWPILQILALSFACIPLSSNAQTNVLYKNDFEQAAIGKVPEDFLVLDGGFTVAQSDGNKFLELPGTPLDSYAVQFGPAGRAGLSVSARIKGTGTGRRFPTFGVGLNGAAGYRLQISPAKKMIELFKDQELKGSSNFDWKPGEWTFLKLQTKAAGSGFAIQAKAWTGGEPEPGNWMVSVTDSEEPNSGRPSVFGSPFSGKPIQFDDLVVRNASND